MRTTLTPTNSSGGFLSAAFALFSRSRGKLGCLLATILFAGPVVAQSGIPSNGLVMRGAIFFAARQGRWTLLTSQGIILGTMERYALAEYCARKAVQISKSSGDEARLATSLRYLGLFLEAAGKSSEAERMLKEALAARKRIGEEDDPAVADALVLLARDQRLHGKKPDLSTLNDAAKVHCKVYGQKSLECSDVLLEQANALSLEGNYFKSDEAFHKVLQIKQEVGNDLDLAEAHRDFAESLRRQGRCNDAEDEAKLALELSERFSGTDDPVVLPALNTLAFILETGGKRDQSEKLRERIGTVRNRAALPATGANETKAWAALVERSFYLFSASEFAGETQVALSALHYAEVQFGPEDWRVAAFLAVLAQQYYNEQADYPRAEAMMERAIRIQEKSLGTEDGSLSETIFHYGEMLEAQRKYRQAEAAYSKAMRIQERAMNIRVAEDPYMSSPRVRLAQIYQREGRFSEAEGLLASAIATQERVGGSNPSSNYAMAELLTGLAFVHESENQFDTAISLLQRSLTYSATAWGLGWKSYKRLSVGLSLKYLGDAYVKRGRYHDAEEAYGRALKTAGPFQTGPATRVRWGLAYADLMQGKFPAAETLLREAMSRAKKSGYDWQMEQTLQQLAYLYQVQNRYGDAEPLLEAAQQIELHIREEDDPSLATTSFHLATNEYALHQRGAAAKHFSDSFRILSRQLQNYFSYMSEDERLGVLRETEQRFPMFYSFVERFYQQEPELATELYNLLLWKKGMVVRSMESLRRKVARTNNPETLKLFDELRARRAQISTLLLDRSSRSKDWHGKMHSLKEHADDLERELVLLSHTYADLKERERPPTWEQIRQSLQKVDADAAIEFVRFPFYTGELKDRNKWAFEGVHYIAMVITPDSTVPTLIPLGDAAGLENELLTGGSNSISFLHSEVAGSLYEFFWKRIETVIAQSTHLSKRNLPRIYVSTDGILNEIPLNVLPTMDGLFLIDKYDLRVVNSTADLLQDPLPVANTAVLIGNPNFNISETAHVQAVANWKASRAKSRITDVSPPPSDEAGRSVQAPLFRAGATCAEPGGDLPGAKDEVKEIVDVLRKHGWDVDPPYIGDEALEEVVKQVRHPRLLHLATHGYFCPDPQVPAFEDTENVTFLDPMLRSGLLFAGANRVLEGENRARDVEDGVLTAFETSMIDLEGTELVVLSACKTGLGDNQSGEGVFGLRRAIQEAGANAVLITMWRVRDPETKQLMLLFYQYWLSGLDKHAALRRAQLELRDQLRTVGRDSPFFWGAFVLVGR